MKKGKCTLTFTSKAPLIIVIIIFSYLFVFKKNDFFMLLFAETTIDKL